MKNTLLPSEKQLHRKFSHYGANAKLRMRKCILLLPQIEKHEIWKKKGFGSIYEYAVKLAGMNHQTVDDALRILRKIEDKPELQKIVEIKGINAVRPVAAIATVETAAFWAEKARDMSKHTLEIYVHEYRKLHDLEESVNEYPKMVKNQFGLFEPGNDGISRTGTWNGTNRNLYKADQMAEVQDIESERIAISMELDPAIAEQLQKLKGRGDWNDLMKQFLAMREEQLEENKPEPVVTDSRHIPVAIMHHVIARTNGQCAYPGCCRPAEILHHTQRFALEKVHDPDRLQSLCKPHERIAHQGLIDEEDRSPNWWKLRKQADTTSPKFAIDQIVNRFRLKPAG